jgi:hypothetical protein
MGVSFLNFKKISIYLFGIASITSAQAFVPTVNPRAQKPFLSDEDQVTLANPLTYGEITARLTGHEGTVRLVFDDQEIQWDAMTSERGILQGWGAPFMQFQQEDTIQDMDQALRRFVEENRNQLQVQSALLRLDPKRTKFSGPYRYVTYNRYQPTDNGLVPVEGAFITFRFKFGRLIQFTNNTFGRIEVADQAMISQEDAIDTVVQDSGFISNQDSFSGKVVRQLQPYYAENRELRFRSSFEIQLRKKKPHGVWRYSVNGSDGRVVRILNGLHTAGHVSAEVYPRLPTDATTQVSIFEANVRGGGQNGVTDKDGNFSFDAEGAMVELSGPRVVIKKAGRATPSQQMGSDGEVMFAADQHLSETMPFYYVNLVNRFVRNFIKGAPRDTIFGKVDFLNSPLTINTRANNEQMPGCNAWFDGGDQTLNFLEADEQCEASAHFSDIIFHEWGHGLDDALGGIQDDSFSEAIGDVTAVLMTGDGRMAPGFVKDRQDPIRDLRSLKIYPRDRSRDPHAESLIVSGAWFEVLQMMNRVYGDEGRMRTAEIFFKHLVTTDSYLDSYMGALAIDDDDGNLSNCTPHMCLFNLAFAKRGIAAKDPRCSTQEAVESISACAPSTIKPPTLD